ARGHYRPAKRGGYTPGVEDDSTNRTTFSDGDAVPRVVIVDDHRLFRSGVRGELGDSVEVLGEAGDVDSAVHVISDKQPDLVLLDVLLPGGGGVEVLRRVLAQYPRIRSRPSSLPDAAQDVIRVERGGARGSVTKTISGKELSNAIVPVVDGDAVFSPSLAV